MIKYVQQPLDLYRRRSQARHGVGHGSIGCRRDEIQRLHKHSQDVHISTILITIYICIYNCNVDLWILTTFIR
jgi:hypothetical protein